MEIQNTTNIEDDVYQIVERVRLLRLWLRAMKEMERRIGHTSELDDDSIEFALISQRPKRVPATFHTVPDTSILVTHPVALQIIQAGTLSAQTELELLFNKLRLVAAP